MKRLLSLILAFILTFTAIGAAEAFAAEMPIVTTEKDTMTPFAATAVFTANGEDGDPAPVSEAALPFWDVSENSWYREYVAFVYKNGYMNGVSDTEFGPEGTLTRAQIVAVLYRLSGSPKGADYTAFTDISDTQYYYPAVLWAEQNGIVNGTSPTTFSPGDDVTRQQIAAILYRYAGNYLGQDVSANADLSVFLDKDSIHSYAVDAFTWTVGVGLFQGFMESEGYTLKPLDTATRAQFATLLYRLCGLGYDFTSGGNNGDIETHTGRSSDAIIDFIKEREGFSSTPYWDYSQWTVGYGTCCRNDKGERCTDRNNYGEIADRYIDISREEGERLLREALAEDYEISVKNYEEKHDLSFSQGEFDALVSFTFNLGALWTTGGYIINDCLENPDTTDLELVYGMGVWCRVGGSVATGTCNRRLRESAIFLYDDYTGKGDHTQFCYVRFKGNGSLLTSRYTDDVGYFTAGLPYGQLPTPTWNPPAGTASVPAESDRPVFEGWYTSDGKKITRDTVVKDSLVLTAKWTTG